MKLTRYFKIGSYAYFGNNITFLIDTSSDSWMLYSKEGIQEEYQSWKRIPCDGAQLKNYICQIARPETWKMETKSFLKRNEVYAIMDGTSIEAQWNFGDGVKRRSYQLDCYEERLLVGLREAKNLIKELKGIISNL